MKKTSYSNYSRMLELAGEGCTINELANHIGMCSSTFYREKTINSEFEDVFNRVRKADNQTIERSLFKSAIGDAESTREEFSYDADDNLLGRRLTVSKSPSVNAQMFWLQKHDKEKYDSLSAAKEETVKSLNNQGLWAEVSQEDYDRMIKEEYLRIFKE